MTKDIKQLPGEINKIVDSYFPYEKIIQIPINEYFFHFLAIRGIYFLYTNNKIVYIGISTNIGKRLRAHIINKNTDKKDITSIKVIRYQRGDDIFILETQLIEYFKPFYNKRNPHMNFVIFTSNFNSDKLANLVKRLEKIEEELGIK